LGRLLGYARVSTDDQNLDLQISALRQGGVSEDQIYTDQVTGAKTERPGLDALMAECRDGDTIIIWRLDRLGRSVVHLATLSIELQTRGVGLRSLSDGVDTGTATGRLVYGLLATLAEFERETIRERVRAGMKAAKMRGVHVGRRKALTTAQLHHARVLREDGKSYAEIAALVGCDRSTVYRSLIAA
jgi:DNA invertase Pin-like site-specific DNA recombinase